MSNTGQITRNTIVLYCRMLFQMAVFLYTSRLTFRMLGVVDYGLYDIVGGLVVMLVFLNNSLATCTQRYITYALGTKDLLYINKVYSTSINIHLLFAVIVLVAGETVGLWYVCNRLVFPLEKLSAVMVAYQCSLVTAIMMIISIPYNACIIAHEKMTAFAGISILDVLMKLGVALLLGFFADGRRLIPYVVMMMSVAVITRMTYSVYCSRRFKELSYIKTFDRELFMEMLRFSGWSTFGNLSIACNTQGLNLLLNWAGGPVLNAARSVAFQIQTATTQFIASFQTAVNPQITKSYAQKDLDGMRSLIMRSSRLSFMLIVLMVIPLVVEAPGVIGIWLGRVPDYSVVFMRLMLCTTLVDAVANPLMVGASSTGNIKRYHLMVGGTLLTALPIAFIALRCNANPDMVFVVLLIVTIVAHCVRMYVCRDLFGFSIGEYISEVLSKIVLTGLIAMTIPVLLHFFCASSNLMVIGYVVVDVVWIAMTVFIVGLKDDERKFVVNKIMRR